MTDPHTRAVEAAAKTRLMAYEDASQEWADRLFNAAKTEQHGGDCTNMPGACIVCIYEEEMLLAEAAIRAYLAAMEAEGMVMVPVEPTLAMAAAMGAAYYAGPADGVVDAEVTKSIYRAMIAARPKVDTP